MERYIGKIWSVKEGSKKIWKVQFPAGIMSFDKKNEAERWVNSLLIEYRREVIK